ncbi:uncharacterized protein LOC114851047 isoform X3 [Betta splendens]|uniref:Uncharacterized protein LOC114851047 isoform X3 n=1 Tax=Betta splendens TaxID=158456 RepID=A0A6P7LWY2_BETSP|nr:uncharacterized protein LOC114851047 isoform X3 [Betta splendens]
MRMQAAVKRNRRRKVGSLELDSSTETRPVHTTAPFGILSVAKSPLHLHQCFDQLNTGARRERRSKATKENKGPNSNQRNERRNRPDKGTWWSEGSKPYTAGSDPPLLPPTTMEEQKKVRPFFPSLWRWMP